MYGTLVQTASISTDGSITSAIDIRGAGRIAIEFPTFSVGIITATANVKFQVSNALAGTYRPLYADGRYSGASGLQQVELPSTSGNLVLDAPWLCGHSYMKIQISNTATAAYNPAVYMMMKPPY